RRSWRPSLRNASRDWAWTLLSGLLGECVHLRGERALEGGPLLAARLVDGERGNPADQIGVAQDAEHGGHEQVAGAEAAFEILAAVERRREIHEPAPGRLLRARAALLGPLLV